MRRLGLCLVLLLIFASVRGQDPYSLYDLREEWDLEQWFSEEDLRHRDTIIAKVNRMEVRQDESVSPLQWARLRWYRAEAIYGTGDPYTAIGMLRKLDGELKVLWPWTGKTQLMVRLLLARALEAYEVHE